MVALVTSPASAPIRTPTASPVPTTVTRSAVSDSDAAAHAALLALTRGQAGVYNVAEPDGALTVDKAQRDLGFNPAFRLAA